MTLKKAYIGSFGPILYNDDDLVNDADGDFSGEYHQGLVTDGDILVEGSGVVGGDLTVDGDVSADDISLSNLGGVVDRIICLNDEVVCLNNNVVTL